MVAAILRSSYAEKKAVVSRQAVIIEIWDTEKGKVVKTIEWNQHEGRIATVRFSNNGQYLATGRKVVATDKIRDAVWLCNITSGEMA